MPDLGGDTANSSFPLSERLQRLRQQIGISQRELARRAGITNGNLSQIEHGAVSPSFSTLEKILQALGISITEFFADQTTWIPAVVRAADFHQVQKQSVQFSVMPITEVQSPRLYLLRQTLPPGASINTSWEGHEGILAGIVVEGELVLTLDGESFTLAPGDGFHFALHRRFKLHNPGGVACVLVATSISPAV